MEKITNIISKKQDHFHIVSPESSANNALCQMSCENVDYLVVLDENKSYIGLISEHDIACRVIVANKQIDKTKVKEIMNSSLPMATTEDTVEKCMRLMRQHHVRYLPIFENFHFKGIVSTEDILEEAVLNRMEIFDVDLGKTGRFGTIT
jgi:CBS domain-containing protein